MSSNWGVLGQVKPNANTLTTLYTVPAGTNITLEVIMCNTGAATSVRLSYAISGAADAPVQYMLYDLALLANDAISTTRITAAAGAVLRGSSSSGNVNFTVNGIEENA